MLPDGKNWQPLKNMSNNDNIVLSTFCEILLSNTSNIFLSTRLWDWASKQSSCLNGHLIFACTHFLWSRRCSSYADKHGVGLQFPKGFLSGRPWPCPNCKWAQMINPQPTTASWAAALSRWSWLNLLAWACPKYVWIGLIWHFKPDYSFTCQVPFFT